MVYCMKPTFFPTPAAEIELLVGFYKKDSGTPSITWPESVDEALCFGWIDGIRKSLGDVRYTIRFTPRKRGSNWSAVNIARAQRLIKETRMEPAGLAAFEARKEDKSGLYSYEQRSVELVEPYNGLLKKNRIAWEFFQAQSPSYRKAASWFILSAKKEETRLNRLEKLAKYSAREELLPEFLPRKKGV